MVTDRVRYILPPIEINPIMNDILICILCNPATINGKTNNKDDNTIQWLRNNLDLNQYKYMIIINIISLIEKKLENINITDINELNFFHDENIINIQNILVLYNNNNTKILFACGQHFITSTIPKNMRNEYKKYFEDIYKILKNYKDKLYCLALTQNFIEINKKKILLPAFPNNRNIKKMNVINNKCLLNQLDYIE